MVSWNDIIEVELSVDPTSRYPLFLRMQLLQCLKDLSCSSLSKSVEGKLELHWLLPSHLSDCRRLQNKSLQWRLLPSQAQFAYTQPSPRKGRINTSKSVAMLSYIYYYLVLHRNTHTHTYTYTHTFSSVWSLRGNLIPPVLLRLFHNLLRIWTCEANTADYPGF